jgi:(R)-amidase
VNAVLAQLEPVRRDLAANVRTASEVVGRCARSDLVVFPELFLSGYDLEVVEDFAVDPEGDEIAPIREACARASVAAIVGYAEVLPCGGVANSAVFLDARGNVAGSYRKTHLFGDEKERFVAGDSLTPVELAGRRLGPMICFDVELSEVARTLARRGADMLVTISANMEPFGPDHDTAARARTLKNGLPHLYVNLVGEVDPNRFTGNSQAVDPEGRVLLRAEAEPQLVLIKVGEGGRSDLRLRYLDLTRDELYEVGSGVRRFG